MNVRRASAVDDVLGVDTLPDEAEIAALRYGGGWSAVARMLRAAAAAREVVAIVTASPGLLES